MARLRRFLLRLSNVFHPERAEPDLARQLASHLTLLEDDFRRRGMTPEEARLAARRAFGGVEHTKDLHRDVRSFVWLDDARQDLHYAIRMVRKNPAFTVVAVTMLAVGIGVNTAVFSLTNTMLFKGFPSVVRNDRILYIGCQKAGGACGVSIPDFEDWRAQATSFEDMAIVNGLDLVLSDKSLPETMFAAQVSVNAFKVIGQRPTIGRDFASSDATLGAAPVAILSYGLWERRYGKDPAIIGQTIKIGGTAAGYSDLPGESSAIAPTTVIGVMAQGFSFPFKETLWVPLVPIPSLQKREARSLWFAFGRMIDGVTIESARAEMDTIGRRLASAYPLTNQGIRLRVRTFRDVWAGPNAPLIYGSMWGAVGCVLLIACANLANLLLARAMSRSREMSVRIALGAGRWRIIRQLLIESVMLSAMGGVFGWWMAAWGVRTYVLAQPPGTNFDYAMDYRVLGYLIATSIGAGFLFGLAPASRLSTLDVNATLKDGGRGATGGRRRHLSALLVIGEMALAVVLLTGAGVMIRSFLKIYTADLGVNAANVLTMYVRLPGAKYPRAESQISFYDRFKMRLEAIPGVESIAFTNAQPTGYTLTIPYELAGAPPVDEQRRPTVSALTISPGYFRILGAAVLSGREFKDSDEASGIPNVIVNQRFATTFWPGEGALGKRLRLFDGTTPDAWLTVVGVVSNIVQNDPTGQRIDPLIYVPYRQKPRRGGMLALARTRVPPGSLGTAFRREIQALDSDVPFIGLSTLAERLKGNYRNNEFFGVLFSMFAAIALLLASVGLYAVVAHSVSQRTQEIGIRTVMGATTRDILRLVFKQGMLPVGIGLTIGLPAALAVTPILKSQLVSVSPTDPITLLVASGVLVLSATLGCCIPARRAMRVDPAVALRHE
jgi:putative ABC transport system permease protein